MSILSFSRRFMQINVSHLACLGMLVNNVSSVVHQGFVKTNYQDPNLPDVISSVARMSAVSKTSKSFCSNSSANAIQDVSFDELRKLLNAHSVVLMDVREPKELREDGKIPGSINVPLGEVESALQLPADKFASKYGSNLPSKDESEKLIMTCRSGKRATTACNTAVKFGYEGVRCYCGSFLDWVEKGGPIEKP